MPEAAILLKTIGVVYAQPTQLYNSGNHYKATSRSLQNFKHNNALDEPEGLLWSLWNQLQP